jgi:predicted aconitase with swiveling domain
MQSTILKGRVIVEGHCKAEALVSQKPISFLGGVDPADGKIIEKNHDLCGECVKDKVLCFPHGHGSTVGSYVLYSLAKKQLAPKAIINQTADPVVVVGAIIADIPMIDQVDIKRIRTGDVVEVDATKGVIKILKKGGVAERACI